MAGSYSHCTEDDGSFKGEGFTDMIENLGDAYEACEMMHWMINYLAEDKEQIADAAEEYYRYLRIKDSRSMQHNIKG